MSNFFLQQSQFTYLAQVLMPLTWILDNPLFSAEIPTVLAILVFLGPFRRILGWHFELHRDLFLPFAS
jgi:hypothetical protein